MTEWTNDSYEWYFLVNQKQTNDLNEPFFVKQLPTVRPIYNELVLFSKSNTPKKRKSGQLKNNLAHVNHVEFIIHTF